MNENWFKLLEKYERGDFIEGVVIAHASFGVFLNLNAPPVLGLIRIVSFTDKERMTVDLFPKIGTKLKGIITDFNEDNLQVNISVKPSDFERFKKIAYNN